MKDFLLFKTLIAHTLVKVFFYIGIVFLILGYFAMTVLALFNEGIGAGLGVGIFGLFFVVFYLILLRVSAEMMIVMFQIYDELKELNSKM